PRATLRHRTCEQPNSQRCSKTPLPWPWICRGVGMDTTVHIRALLCGMAVWVAAATFANKAVLEVDGMLRVKSLGMDGARMVIIDENGGTEVVEQGLSRFRRSL